MSDPCNLRFDRVESRGQHQGLERLPEPVL
jgi:hypothetical protein